MPVYAPVPDTPNDVAGMLMKNDVGDPNTVNCWHADAAAEESFSGVKFVPNGSGQYKLRVEAGGLDPARFQIDGSGRIVIDLA